MSFIKNDDPEEVTMDTEGKKKIHYGSLEEKEKERLITGASGISPSVLAGIKAGNINVSNGNINIDTIWHLQCVLTCIVLLFYIREIDGCRPAARPTERINWRIWKEKKGTHIN